MTVVHQMQPTYTSCGATCVAMLADVSVEHAFATWMTITLPVGQSSESRLMNIASMFKLLRQYKLHLGRRFELSKLSPGMLPPLGLLRVHAKRFGSDTYRNDWHWLVISGGFVYDPEASSRQLASVFFHDHRHDRIYFYEVTAS